MSAPKDRSVPAARRPAIQLEAIRKTYGEGDTAVHAIAHVDLTVNRGEYIAIMGASGSGKSTLMNIVGCLDAPTAGRYLLDGTDVRKLDEHQLSVVRNKKIGFIFQSFNLIPRTSALSNVELPLIYAGISGRERRERAMAALEKVGLTDRRSHMPSELSGGQQQRVAVARAIVTDPVLLLADEPTGALDSKSTADVLDLFQSLASSGRTIMVITHEDEVGSRAGRLVVMRDGLILSDAVNRSPDQAHLMVAGAAHLAPGGGSHGVGAPVQQTRAAYEPGASF
ncbi:MAG TPA: ABC transporter ATP-binding protein [Sporichthyaceae bacterium]|jgi:putative ABC transport system ATP-binding protein|nr:ABC transporter ATP-binding protein [Sporichthyaceae bacterium]